jgi:hypothetical protein
MFDYPALYKAAGILAEQAQVRFLRLVRGEYALLIVAAVLSLDLSAAATYFVFYAFVFLAALAVLVT